MTFNIINRYVNNDTILLANSLLPVSLVGLTKNQIKNKINSDYNLFKTLGHFSVRTEQYKKYRQNGMDFPKYKVNWKNISNKKSLEPFEMINLNYLIYTYPNASNLSSFAFAVNYASGLNYNYYFQQAQSSEGRYVPYSYIPFS